MAVTTEKSTYLTNLDASPVVYDHAVNIRGKARRIYYDFTQGVAAGDANSTVDLVRLPAGRVRVYMPSSALHNSAFGASRTLDVGNLAYEDIEGDTIAAAVDALINGADVAAAALATTAELIGGSGVDVVGSMLFESKVGVTLQAIVLGGTIPAAATLRGYFDIVQE